MLISLNKLKQYVKIDLPTSDLLDLIGSRLVEIEEVHDLSPKYSGIKIVKVVSAEKIEGTHLSLCQIDADPSVASNTSSSSTSAAATSPSSASATNALVQVVCGAPNVHSGMLAVWIMPGSVVPSTFGNENFRLSVRKLQGHESHGMLAALDELDLGTDHDGIVEIDPKQTFTDPATSTTRTVKPGDNFSDVFDLNDTIIDVENKSLTHRPDCFGLVGFAREIAGILGQPFTEPEWLSAPATLSVGGRGDTQSSPFKDIRRPAAEDSGLAPVKTGRENRGPQTGSLSVTGHNPSITTPQDTTSASVTVTVSDPELCPRYSCAIFDLPSNSPSKYLTPEAVFLAKSGMRSIDPMVDLTNILMLETGQPLHAFDYDKLISVGNTPTPEIIVRSAEPGEPLQLLDGKTIECIPEDILITSNNVPIALAGAMGGKNTEIDASTRRVVLESATFSLYHLRKTQMAHGIFSEAITRFTKGQPASGTLPVLYEALSRLNIEPLAIVDEYPSPAKPTPITLTVASINSLLGTSYDQKTIIKTLENVGFAIAAKTDTLSVTAPAWRTDIHLPEDVIEEVGRLLGFDNIPLNLPEKAFTGTSASPMWSFKQELRHLLSGSLAMNELLTYSFVSRSLLEKVGQDLADSYEIVNSISPELECFRQQIVPSLLDKVRENLKSGHKSFSLYEMNQISTKSLGLTSENTPRLETHLGIVTLGDFYALKAKLLALTRKGLGLNLEYTRLSPKAAEKYPYLEPSHSAMFITGDTIIGAFGELKPAVLRRFKLDAPISVAELTLDALVDLPRNTDHNLKLSRFPFVERDLTLKVASDAEFGRFYAKLDTILSAENLISVVTPLSIYQSDPASPTKNISFHLKFASPSDTLSSEAISAIMEKVTVEITQLGAEIV